jgi:hypothetical protein
MTDQCHKQSLVQRWNNKGVVDLSKAPRWWPSTAEESERVLHSLPGVQTFEIGRSAGGRPIIAGAWGRRESLPQRTSQSLASALACGSPAAFYGQGRRRRQSFVFLGNAHGLEFEGTVAALNMLHVVVTGKDLRGRAWPRLQHFGRKLRIVVIPHLNIDGRTRYPWYRHSIAMHDEDHRRIFFGDLEGVGELEYPTLKRYWPIPVDRMSQLGAYYNDNGVNLVYDSGLGADLQPETKALLSFLRIEQPDCVLLSHTDQGSLVNPDSFIPKHYRLRQAQIGALVGNRCFHEGMKVSRIPPDLGDDTDGTFYQSDLVYHACGALPLMVEFPAGWEGVCGSFKEILDIGLYMLEETFAFGVSYQFRPSGPC